MPLLMLLSALRAFQVLVEVHVQCKVRAQVIRLMSVNLTDQAGEESGHSKMETILGGIGMADRKQSSGLF